MRTIKLLLAIVLFTSPIYAQSDRNGDSDSNSTREEVPFAVIEQAPVYPGCEGSDEANLKRCMSQKIQEYVGHNFDMKKMESLGLDAGTHRISVIFKVNKQGHITDVQATSSNPEVKKEAMRVVSSLPKMKAGKHKGKKVSVIYSLPIVFKIEPDKVKTSRDSKGQ